jgi:hypothetical protein
VACSGKFTSGRRQKNISIFYLVLLKAKYCLPHQAAKPDMPSFVSSIA